MRSSNKGITTLPVVLLISSIVIELTIAGVVLAALFSNTVLNSKLSSEALAAARTGAQDAIMKIIRDKNCNASSCGGAAVPYTITINSRTTAYVSLVDNPDDTLTINSIGTAVTRKKKIQAVVGIDPNSGGVNILSLGEVPL